MLRHRLSDVKQLYSLLIEQFDKTPTWIFPTITDVWSRLPPPPQIASICASCHAPRCGVAAAPARVDAFILSLWWNSSVVTNRHPSAWKILTAWKKIFLPCYCLLLNNLTFCGCKCVVASQRTPSTSELPPFFLTAKQAVKDLWSTIHLSGSPWEQWSCCLACRWENTSYSQITWGCGQWESISLPSLPT